MVDKNNFYIHHRVIHHRDYKQSPNENLLYIDSIENFSKFNFCFVVNEEQEKLLLEVESVLISIDLHQRQILVR